MTGAVAFRSHIVLRTLIVFAFFWQAVLPGVQVAAGFDARAYMCSPQSKPPPEATAQLKAILKLAGKFEPERPQSDINPDHCSNCVISGFAVLAHDETGDRAQYFVPSTLIAENISQMGWGLRGPPVGSRAPPLDV